MDNTNYTLRKKICFEDFTSRKDGIMPYCEKDTDFNGIKYPVNPASDSNYGFFPCDFVTIQFSEYKEYLGFKYKDFNELSRLKYMDIVSWYNESIEIVNRGKLLKRHDYQIETENPVVCDKPVDETNIEDTGNQSEPGHNEKSNNRDIDINKCYTVKGTEEENGNFYNYYMADVSLFKIIDGKYIYDKSNTDKRDEIKGKYDNWNEEATDEEKYFIRKINHHILSENSDYGTDYAGGIIFDSNSKYDYLYFVDNYDTIIKYADLWQNWWDKNWNDSKFPNKPGIWEYYYFGNTYPNKIKSFSGKNFKDFKFIYDFEKYFIGKEEVPKNIKGEKVPNVVYYLNVIDYIQWFIANEENKDDDELKSEWEKRGGDDFYNFLSGVTEKSYFIDWESKENILSAQTSGATILCRPQNVEIDFQMIGEISDEKLLTPYENSMDKGGNFYDATIEYEHGVTNEIESALTPMFKVFDEGEIIVESQLRNLYSDDTYYVNEDVYGVFDTFPSSSGLFSCEFYEQDSQGDKEPYCSGTTSLYIDGEFSTSYTINYRYDNKRNPISDIVPNTKGNAYTILTNDDKTQPPVIESDGNRIEQSGWTADSHTYLAVSAISQYYERTYKKWKWCECIPISETGIDIEKIKCCDGEYSENDEFNYGKNQTEEYKYRNILILDCALDISSSQTNGDKYLYMAKYDNGYVDYTLTPRPVNSGGIPKFLKIPYVCGKEMNIESYDGEYSGTVKYDIVESSALTDDTLTIEYVIGAESAKTLSQTGIHYKEDYYYESAITGTIVDGFYNAHVLYEKITPKETAEVYSEDLNAKRTAVLANITGMEIGTQWTSGSSIKTYLFNEEGSDFMMEYPLIDADISFNRGNATAFEKHFKLGECNTMEDLESYGNGYFLE